jgi:hypothetical protein
MHEPGPVLGSVVKKVLTNVQVQLLLPQSYLACLARKIKNIADNKTRIQNSHLAQACFSSEASLCLDAAFSRTARRILSYSSPMMAHLQLIAEPMAVPSAAPAAMAPA